VRRRVQLPRGEYIFGEFPDGSIGGFPAWMTDPAICAACPIGSPMPSAASLGELQKLLDSVRSGSLDASASLEGTPRENPHATEEEPGVDADGIAIQPSRPDHPANGQATRSNRRTRRPAAQRGNR
jgi:hypothetical protein